MRRAAVVYAAFLIAGAAGIWEDGEDAEVTDGYTAEEEDVSTEDASGSEEEQRPWMEPHYFMRPHIYVDRIPTTGASYIPQRQEVLERTYKIVKLDRKYLGPQLSGNLRGRSIQLNFGKDAKYHKKNLVVDLSDETVPMVGAGGAKFTCHVPSEDGLETLNATEVNALVAKADKDMAADINQGCWVATMPNFGMEYCWNRTYTVFDLNARGRRTKHTLIGKMMNRTHEYQVVPEGVYHDPLTLRADYTDGDVCDVPDPLTNATRRWSVSIFYHCTLHSPDHHVRDRWGTAPRPVPWAFGKDPQACQYRVDIWSKGVCTATLPLLHLNRKYILCLEDGVEGGAGAASENPAAAARGEAP